MDKANYILVPNPSITAGARFVKNVTVKENNRVANDNIPANLAGDGFGDLCTFLRCHPLQGALFNTVSALYPRMLNEWWYTCTANDVGTTLTGTYNNGEHTLLITEDIIRYALDLPREDQVSYRFRSVPDRQKARTEAFPLVGQNTTTGTIKYGMFKGKWQFLFSTVVRCLGGKSGSQDQMNEFETTLFHSLVTGRKIDYAHVYFQEILSYVNTTPRMFNVPFIRVLSLCFEKLLGEQKYADLSQTFFQAPVHKISDKIFHNILRYDDEVGLTPTMLAWIENPYVAPAETESEVSDSDSDSDSGSHPAQSVDIMDVSSSEDTETTEEILRGLIRRVSKDMKSTGTSSKTEGKSDADPAQTIQPTHSSSHPSTQSEVFVTSQTTPVGPIWQLVDPSPRTQISAQMDFPIHEFDGYVPHSSASDEVFSTRSESEFIESDKTNPSQTSIINLEKHITAAVETPTASIEDVISLLDPPTFSVDTPFTSSLLKDPIFTSSVLVHTSQTLTSSTYTLAQVANVTLPEQSVIQTSISVSSDRVQLQPVCCEGTPTLPFVTYPFQSEVSQTSLILAAIEKMSNKFDDKFSEMQAEIKALRDENPKDELKKVTDLVSTLAADMEDLKKNKYDSLRQIGTHLEEVNRKMKRVDTKMGEIASLESRMKALHDDVKKGEKELIKVVFAGTQTEDLEADVEMTGGKEIVHRSEFVDAQTQTDDIQADKNVFLDQSEKGGQIEGEQSGSECDNDDEPHDSMKISSLIRPRSKSIEDIVQEDTGLNLNFFLQTDEGKTLNNLFRRAQSTKKRKWNEADLEQYRQIKKRIKVSETHRLYSTTIRGVFSVMEGLAGYKDESEDDDDESEETEGQGHEDDKCKDDDIIPDEEFDADYGGEGLGLSKNLKSSSIIVESEKNQSDFTQTGESSQTQTKEKTQTQSSTQTLSLIQPLSSHTGPIQVYTNVVELPPVPKKKPTVKLADADLTRPVEDRVLKKVLSYEGKGKGKALNKDQIKARMKVLIDEMLTKERSGQAEDIPEPNEWEHFYAKEQGITIDEYRRRITEELTKMSPQTQRKMVMKGGYSKSKEIISWCDFSTFPGADVFTPEEVNLLRRWNASDVVGAVVKIEKGNDAEKPSEPEQTAIDKERIRLTNVQQFFKKSSWSKTISKIDHELNEKYGLVLKCVVDRKRVSFPMSQMFKLGFKEWSRIAELSDTIADYDIRMEIKREAVYLVNMAFQLGYLTQEEYQQFCLSNNVKLNKRSLGLDSTYEGINPHPVPKEINFVNRMYVRTENYEGLCYLDPINEEAFQDIKDLSSNSLSHCIALLNECEEEECLPFRKRLISWLFNNLLAVKKIHGTQEVVKTILDEYQQLFDKTDAEMKSLIKIKIDRIKELRKES